MILTYANGSARRYDAVVIKGGIARRINPKTGTDQGQLGIPGAVSASDGEFIVVGQRDRLVSGERDRGGRCQEFSERWVNHLTESENFVNNALSAFARFLAISYRGTCLPVSYWLMRALAENSSRPAAAATSS